MIAELADRDVGRMRQRGSQQQGQLFSFAQVVLDLDPQKVIGQRIAALLMVAAKDVQ
jgi:hypothetical protein